MNGIIPNSVIQFAYTENEVENLFIDWIISFDDSPIDSACSNIIRIKKSFYPVYLFKYVYSAWWSAQSIWEHKEEYTEYETKIVFVDNVGYEHSRGGYDNVTENGRTVSRPWQAVSKQIPKTRSKTVIDNTQRTQGSLNNQQFSTLYTSTGNNDFDKWLKSLTVSNKVVFTPEIVDDIKVEELNIDDSAALYAADEALKETVDYICRSNIPGTRYTDFKIDEIQVTHELEVILFPVYEVSYQYGGSTYTVFFSVDKNIYCFNRPIDESYVKYIANINEQINIKKQANKLSGCFIWILLIFGILCLPLTLSYTSRSGALYWFLFWIIFILEIFGFIKMIQRAISPNKKINAMIQYVENYKQNVRLKRNAVAGIIKNPDMSPEEKNEQISNVLNT